MRQNSAHDLVALLNSSELRIRTGVLEIPPNDLGMEKEMAIALETGYCNLGEWRLARIPSTRKTLDLGWERIVADLEEVFANPEIFGACVLVCGVDVLLAGTSFEHRKDFWNFTWGTFRPGRGLMLTLPSGATNLFPEELRREWEENERLYTLQNLDEVFVRLK
jgi:hypothetical protein